MMRIQEFVADVLPLSVRAIGVGAREAGLIAPLPGYGLVRGAKVYFRPSFWCLTLMLLKRKKSL